MSPVTRWHIFFSGRVQFVGFRYQACLLAKKLGLTGWVQNLGDGRVEMEVQGNAGQIRKLLIGLKDRRPIRIDRMEVREIPPVPGEKKFGVKGYESVY